MVSSLDLVGQTLGGYQLVELIGSGAMAMVFKAHQAALDRWVAVKILHYKDKNALLRFQREARAVALLRHRNILIVYEYGEEGDWPYIVMEYVQGGTLSDHLTQHTLEWATAINLAIPIAEALRYAHQQGIIHRDVKPSNILLPQPDWPLLADFGLVKIASGDEQSVTGSGVSLGTPAYVAPEQARGVAIDHRVDIYSLGVILFEMVAGRLPFNYAHPNKVLMAHISEPVPSPRQFNPQCPIPLERVIIKALQKYPDSRYQDMAEVIVDLREVISGSDTPILSERTSSSDLSPATSVPSPEPAEVALPLPPGPRLLLADKNIPLMLPDKAQVIVGRTHREVVVDIDLGPYGAAQLGISRRHAQLIRQGQQWFIDDLGSLNGTFVNNVQVKPGHPIPLHNGDVIRCSHLIFRFLLS